MAPTRIWIVNVGDLKPMEFPIEFFPEFRAGIRSVGPRRKSGELTTPWAEREFGSAHAAEIADIVTNTRSTTARASPSCWSPDTFSLVDYQRSRPRRSPTGKELIASAEKISAHAPARTHATRSSNSCASREGQCAVTELYVTAAKNRLFAEQGRAATNDMAAHARALYQADIDLTDYFNHTLAGGKWNHMMDQTHIGYTGLGSAPTQQHAQGNGIDADEYGGLRCGGRGFDRGFAGREWRSRIAGV